MTDTPDRWHLATTAAAALSVDPQGLGGIVLRDRAGPVRDAYLQVLTEICDLPTRRLPGTLDQAAFSDGIDLSETLRTGRQVQASGLLSQIAGKLVVVPMAERIEAGTTARLANALDRRDAPTLVLLDEAAEPDEGAPAALSDRLALAISLDGLSSAEAGVPAYDAKQVAIARKRISCGIEDSDALSALTGLSAAIAIPSLRAPHLALKLARVLAALDGQRGIDQRHIAMAAALCLAPRARAMPQSSEDTPDQAPPPPEDTPQDKDEQSARKEGQLEDKVLDAVAAMLPSLALTGGRQRGAAASTGAGDRKRSASHGRPVRPRPGKPHGNRLDVFSTLLAAAPWQPVRQRATPDRSGLVVLPQDFRIKQYDRPSESVLIFLVDASGSQAAARMAEAKGAVELMLSEAYRRREKVALIAFRGKAAEMILPPTRSLLQAKRRLSVLPGGGPTPLASALVVGRELALQLRRRGTTPYLILLTDGRGNIGLDGEPGRKQAAEDQTSAARAIAAEGLISVLIDTANRPQADAKALAATMDAQYLPLPRADAHGISRMVRASVAA